MILGVTEEMINQAIIEISKELPDSIVRSDEDTTLQIEQISDNILLLKGIKGVYEIKLAHIVVDRRIEGDNVITSLSYRVICGETDNEEL